MPRFVTHLFTIAAVAGISLIVSYDHKDVSGTYTSHGESLIVKGYEHPPETLHSLGVLLLFSAGALTHLILLLQYSVIQGQCVMIEGCDMSVDIQLEQGGEVIYVITMTIFLLCFALNAVTTAIILEYLTLSFYISLFVIAIGTRIDIESKVC